MVLSSCRLVGVDKLPKTLSCCEDDFKTTTLLISALNAHMGTVFKSMDTKVMKTLPEKFYKALPNQFNRQDYLAVADEIEIKPKTAEKYLKQFKNEGLLIHEHNKYTKKQV